MKTLVGGIGLVGTKIVDICRARNEDVIAASLTGGVNSISGEGLEETLNRASVVTDATNAPSSDAAAIM